VPTATTGRDGPGVIVVVDTSVVVKWFHAENEAEVAESRAILAAHRDGVLTAHILDLGVYELGNVLLRALRWSAEAAADQIDDLIVICGQPLVPTPEWRRDATTLAHQHRLTFYDALFTAAARALGAQLVSMDHQLLAADLAETPAKFVSRVGLVL
jgi:predicted nucleic acid-binding protein